MVDVLLRKLIDRSAYRTARIIEENVQAAKLVGRDLYAGSNVFFLSDVSLHVNGVVTQLLRQRLALVYGTAGDDDPSAFVNEQLCGRSSNAAGAARDERYFSMQTTLLC